VELNLKTYMISPCMLSGLGGAKVAAAPGSCAVVDSEGVAITDEVECKA
jgi:hypothetical protein